MSVAATTVALIAASTAAAGGAVSAYATREQGIATARENRQKAVQAGIDAKQKQINMRQNMLRTLAAQNAGTLGAVATGRASGFGANAMRQINQNQNDLLVTSSDASTQVSLLDQAASNATSAGNIGALGGLASAAASGISMYQKTAPPTS
jgi:hypothetical protein